MIDILWGFSKDICMISDVVWGKKSQKKDNDIYVQPLNEIGKYHKKFCVYLLFEMKSFWLVCLHKMQTPAVCGEVVHYT